MGIAESSPSGGAPKMGRVGTECAIEYRSGNSSRGAPVGFEEPGGNRGAPVGIGELPSLDEERRIGGMERRMKLSSAKSRQRGLWSAYPSGGAPAEEELTAEGYRRE